MILSIKKGKAANWLLLLHLILLQLSWRSHGCEGQLLSPDSRVTESLEDLPIVLPYEDFEMESRESLLASNVIEGKRYVEADLKRCGSSTVLEVELAPSFVLVTSAGENRLFANSSVGDIRQVGFKPELHTTVLMHGFTQSYWKTPWLNRTQDLFKKYSLIDQHNLILMDWSRAAQGSYSTVAARVSSMGSYLAHFLLKLINELQTDRLKIHLIGHSLGAHISGFAGKRIRPKVGRISSLDPAGPCFQDTESSGIEPDAAQQVDVHHYDRGFLGQMNRRGQYDIFVNGGYQQPNCESVGRAKFEAALTMIFNRDRVLSQSHTRASMVASADLASTGCQLVAYECKDYKSFKRGECGHCDSQNSQCFAMTFAHQLGRPVGREGQLRTARLNKKLYIRTSDEENFCVHHYQILITLEARCDRMLKNSLPCVLFTLKKRQIQLRLEEENGDVYNITATNELQPHVLSYLLLVDGNKKAPKIKSAHLQFQKFSGRPMDMSKKRVRVKAVEINFMSSIDPVEREALSSRLCRDKQKSELEPDSKWVPLSECEIS